MGFNVDRKSKSIIDAVPQLQGTIQIIILFLILSEIMNNIKMFFLL